MKNKKKYLFLILIIPVLVILISRSFSLSYTHEIKSIEIQSNDYNNPGSWHIDKSAIWTGFGKARVTFDINSVMKTIDGRYKDVILIMDISGSMSGENIERAKEDAITLSNYLLSNSRNRVALISFDSNSEVLSGFTNNKSQIESYINGLSASGCTNYNSGLSKIDVVMENYVRDDTKDLVVLFLTDGYPNEDVPNEKSTYGMLKDKYPYMTINGIQYEMGKEIIQDIIDISDYQYYADRETLEDVLFEATVAPITYDNFVVTDYIYDDYFYIESVNDIQVPYGNVTLDNEGAGQKITWDLGNNYITGRNIKMHINLNLKEEYHNTKGLYPTNTSEKIVSKLPDESEKTINSELTPVLKNVYNVIYETNPPEGCNLPSIQNEEHFVYQTVTKRQDNLVCEGYYFKGWYINGSDIADIYLINSDNFIMPSHDVTIRGTWTKQNFVKTMDGTVRVKIYGTLIRDTNNTFGKNISKDSFESITTVNDIYPPATAISFWDASTEKNGSVIAWYTDNDNDGKYELYLGQEDNVIAPVNSSYLFSDFKNVEFIDLEYLDTTNTTKMYNMFIRTGYNASTFTINNLDKFNTSNVTDMSWMFYQSGYNASSYTLSDISNWDTSKVTNMSYMFSKAGYSAPTWNIGNIENWNTGSVTSTDSMFYQAGNNATTFNLNLSNWDTKNLTNMSSMFDMAGCNSSSWSVGDLSNWNTSKVTQMNGMFRRAGESAPTFNIGNIGGWDISHATSLATLFNHAGSIASTWYVGDLSGWNTSNVTSMNGTFGTAGQNARSWSVGDLSGWDTSKVTNMNSMFANAGKGATTLNLGNLGLWDTGNVIDMANMFSSAGNQASSFYIGDLSNWNVSKVTDMSSMFYHAGAAVATFNIGNLDNWNVSKVNTFSSTFSGAGYNATTWSIGDLSNWNISSAQYLNFMFSNTGRNATTWSVGDLSSWRTSNIISLRGMFSGAGYRATSFDISYIDNWNTSNVTDMREMFKYAAYNSTTWNIGDLSGWDTSKVTTMESMFEYFGYNASTFDLSYIANWDTGNVTNMSSMVKHAGYNSTTWNIGDLSNWNTENVINMKSMFYAAGYNSTTWNNIGTLKIYAENIDSMFWACRRAKATLNMYVTPTIYTNAFYNAATLSGALITVNYSSTITNIDDIITPTTTASNIVKGVQLDS